MRYALARLAHNIQWSLRARRVYRVVEFFKRFGVKDVAVALLSVTVVIFLVLTYYAYNLPISADFGSGERRISLLLETTDGDPFGSRGKFMGRVLAGDEIPEVVKQAAVAIEDRRFYDHFGIDLRGLVRAAFTNLFAGRIRQGGSTITQQLAKVMFLSPERTFKRKIQELMLALWLEHHLTKDEILVRYLNSVYFGAGAYGIDGAARRYFNKSAGALSLNEAAMLAGLIRSPSYLAPTRNPDAAAERAELVLKAMEEVGFIDEMRTSVALTAPAKPAVLPDSTVGSNYYADWVGTQSRRLLGSVSADLTVETTFNPAMQDLAERVVGKWLAAEGERAEVGQAALLAMTPDGAVLAMVGGLDYADSQFNRVTQAKRQPGSLFKLAVYLAAFDSGLRPTSVVLDGPVLVDGWQPENHNGEYRGRVTLRTAFADSINTVAVKLAEQVGRERVIGVARRLGITSALEPVPSLALGSSEVTLLEMTAAYAAIAAGVKRVRPYGIRRIRGIHGQGRTLYVYKSPQDQRRSAILPWKRDEMVDLLMTTMREGTGTRAQFGVPAAGKTGTSQDYRDAWFIGFTADLVVGVWVGNDDNSPTAGVVGGGMPALIWRDFMTGVSELGIRGRGLEDRVVDPTGRTAPLAGAAPTVEAPVSDSGLPVPRRRPRTTAQAEADGGAGRGGLAGWVRSLFK